MAAPFRHAATCCLALTARGAFILTSVKGQGTTGELWLPLASGEATTPESSEVMPMLAAADNKRVLVVDDDALVLLNTVTLVEDLGHEVFEATSGEQALSVLYTEEIDLLIRDYAMPKMSGGELGFTAISRWPSIKVFIATAG